MSRAQLKLDSQLCFRLYTASRLITQAYHPFLQELGITYPQYLVLMVLWENDRQLVNDIARRLVLETNTVTPLIQRMEKLGLVTKERGEQDGRQTIVSLTDKGRAMEEQAARVPACMAGMLNACGLESEKLRGLFPALDELIDKVKTSKQ
jgi:DNA-binding MarR family transcriptional regulator